MINSTNIEVFIQGFEDTLSPKAFINATGGTAAKRQSRREQVARGSEATERRSVYTTRIQIRLYA